MLFPNLVAATQSVMTYSSCEFTPHEREVILRFIRVCKLDNPFSSENIEDAQSLTILKEVLVRIYELEKRREPDLKYYLGEVLEESMEVEKKIHHCLSSIEE